MHGSAVLWIHRFRNFHAIAFHACIRAQRIAFDIHNIDGCASLNCTFDGICRYRCELTPAPRCVCGPIACNVVVDVLVAQAVRKLSFVPEPFHRNRGGCSIVVSEALPVPGRCGWWRRRQRGRLVRARAEALVGGVPKAAVERRSLGRVRRVAF